MLTRDLGRLQVVDLLHVWTGRGDGALCGACVRLGRGMAKVQG
jgi:hypothetical protein